MCNQTNCPFVAWHERQHQAHAQTKLELEKMRDELSVKIDASMYKPHEESRRMTEPIVEIKPYG